MTRDDAELPELPANAIAIVGMAVHAPGALDASTLFSNFLAGTLSAEAVDEEALRAAGVSERLLRHPRYVKKTLRLPNLREFEPEFFGMTPRDAALVDPQLRHLYECAWESLEDAAIDPAHPSGPIGLFVGAPASDYLLHNLLPNRELIETHGMEKLMQLGNDRDYICSRIAYALDLRGPCLGIAAACSSGSLSVHSAVQSLIGRECRIALAGAASIHLPHGVGYVYEEGGLSAPDGVCRTFDASAQGTVPSSGVAMVTLMRLEDAVAEGRSIYATILATAYNNDGRRKVGYAAPSVDGPLSAIDEVLAVAGIDARSIGYVEAHGTATPFGDSIEVSALTKAFRQQTSDVGFCMLGSNKPNIGHTDAASGVVSLIKTALSLSTRTVAPLANFEIAHPLLELGSSPFRIVSERAPWESEAPRRALVNCLAVGGTNVVLALEEAPERAQLVHDDAPELLVLSARSTQALTAMQTRLADHLEQHPELTLRDVAYTLRAGRHLFEARKALVAASREDAIAQLRGEGPDALSMSGSPGLLHLIEQARRFSDEREPRLGDELPSEGRQFVHLPSYPFERRTFWTEPEVHTNPSARAVPKTDAQTAIPYAQTRFEERAPSSSTPKPGQRWLVFVDETGLGDQVIRQLAGHGCEIIGVRFGSNAALVRKSPFDYFIDPDRGFEGPSALIAELGREGRLPDVILHLWGITTEERFRSATNRFHHNVERGYFTLLALSQGIAGLETSHKIRLVAVSNGALRTDEEDALFGAKALMFGPLSVIALEQSNVTSCAIDVDVPVGVRRALLVSQLLQRTNERIAELLLPEAAGRGPGIYALRGTQVLERTVASVEAPESDGQASRLRQGGVYLVVGGFGHLGHALARELVARGPIKLVLVGRMPLPDAAYWDEWLAAHPASDPVSTRIQMVRALEASGAEVLALSADVCHLESMRSALTLARRRFGSLHGVVHAAGLVSEALCGAQTLDEARDAIAPEVLGARVLEELLRREKLDFFVTFGHAARFSPRPGSYARNAAAEFSDAFLSRSSTLHPRLFDLGLLRDGGMYVRWLRELEAQGPIHDPKVRALADEIDRGLSTDVAASAVLDAIDSGERQLVIGPIPEPSAPMSAASFARSEIRREYVAPDSETERKLAALWSEALRIDKVGATDDFFELGGHSLIAVRLGARIKTVFGASVPLALLIEAPTVRQLARELDEHMASRKAGDGTQVLREWTTVVPLQPHGERPPLFCVGGKGGNVMNLRHLATLLGREQPVIGLQARGVDGTQRPHETVEAMVDEYLADLQRVRPEGPYLLSGFSGGGVVILEMGRRLRAQGHVVGPLLFFDAWNPATPERNLRAKLRAHAGLFKELGPRYAGLLARRTAAERTQRLLESHAPWIAHRIWEPPPVLSEVADAWENASRDYEPQPYDGDAVLFRVRADRSRGELELSDDEQNGWGGLVLGGIEIIDVPGTHTSLVEEPHVRTLAQSVRVVLDRAIRKLEREHKSELSSQSHTA